MRFTVSNLDKLQMPEGKGDLIVFDDSKPGFGLRLRGGRQTWIVQYRIAGKTRRKNLGLRPEMGLKTAREAAAGELAAVGLDLDPAAERDKAKAAAAITFGDTIEAFLKEKASTLRPSSFREVNRYLRQTWKPFHKRPLASITRQEIKAELVAMTATTAKERARGALSTFFTWALQEGLAPDNPVVAIKPAKLVSRERCLADDELAEVWRACRDDEFGRIIRLLILTGQRREEVGAMEWGELDFDKALWTIPSARTKNKRPHEVPLVPEALDVLGQVFRRGDRELLFGEAEGPFSGWSRAKDALDQRIVDARRRASPTGSTVKPLADWRLHDLRRTAATGMAELGTDPHIVEAVLNHVTGAKAGIAGVYNKAAYRDGKRAALTAWAKHVTTLATPSAPAMAEAAE